MFYINEGLGIWFHQTKATNAKPKGFRVCLIGHMGSQPIFDDHIPTRGVLFTDLLLGSDSRVRYGMITFMRCL